MASIYCKVDIPNIQGADDQILTVGREFYLACEGEWPKDLAQEKLHFETDPSSKYQLKLLGFEFRSITAADLKVTSYIPGPHKFANLVLTDGEKKIELGPVEFQVQSVLQQGEKVEPYGPMGPAVISVPLLYWICATAAVLLLFFVVGFRIWRRQQRQAMLARLKEHESPLTPLQEFHSSMRKLQRANTGFYQTAVPVEEIQRGMGELDRMFKVYLCRRLKVPAFEWGEKLIVADIARHHSVVYEDFGVKIRSLLSEFSKAGVANKKIQEKDLVQLAESLRKAVEGIERVLSEEKKSSGGRR